MEIALNTNTEQSSAKRAKSSTKDYQTDRVTSSKEKIANVIIFILLFAFAITMVFPLIYMVATSFMTKNQILSGTLTLFPNPILIGKYSQVLSKGQFITGIINTITVEIPVLLIGGFTSSLAAFAFAKMNFRGKNALFLALLATIMIPFAVVMIPQYVLFTKLGWTNSLAPLIIPGCFGNVSMIFFLRQNLYSIPTELMDAAKIDGCNYFEIYYKIFLPLMKGALGTQLMLWFMGIWNDYLAPTIFLRSEKHWTLQVVIRSFNSYYAIQSDYALIMAASVIAMLPTLVLFFLFQRVIIESIAISGIK
ncbi:carbohydrate ABC transporter permease [Butyrivibrio sp. AC2005]|uniref:carbohydrate ABC transporter permease n=1 Tax=Butyrivibrio sp. AC2005 TaxID=1280672 RepID=UPI0004070C17|nr:carbohydrate ABC transporter permease [Butyrivibrio sp. AC2005]